MIVGVPAIVPVTTPAPLIAAPLQLHVPPVGPLNVILPPGQMPPVPVMAAGSGFTLIVAVAIQPVPIE